MIHQTTTTEVEKWLAEGTNKVVLDVREAAEVATGKIPGAINIPVGLLPFRVQELDRNQEYIVICLAGGRSMMACDFLSQQNFNVWNVQGGMSAWTGEVE